jgi:nucleotide-binding universal stress UspA family protein
MREVHRSEGAITVPGIVVGIDGSRHSQRALEVAITEAALRHVPLTVLTVHQVVAGYSGHGVAYPGDDTLAEKARQAAQEEVDGVLADLGDSRPASVTVQGVSGLPAEALLAAAKDADMIVVGSRGAGGFSRLLLGSVSYQVAHHARVPVLIVPPADLKP